MEWEEIREQKIDLKGLYKAYLIPFCAIYALSTFVGDLIWVQDESIGEIIGQAIIDFAIPCGSVIILAYAIERLSVNFDSTKDLTLSAKLAIFSIAPALLFMTIGNILQVQPINGLMRLACFYSLYVLWLGFKPVLGTVTEQRMGYTVLTVLIFVGITLVAHLILRGLLAIVF
jgi:Yip1 domain.